ncbi:hypothetical protein QTL91_10750, partial [Salmonella enterica subsp. enterica serovar Typhimurium]|uniref:hypothetical protein n=1 Tax=Salmonella enterica TaxID=28901 RepID=UPI002623144B
ARCFNKSKGVLITGLKLKAFRNPQPSWGFSIDNKKAQIRSAPLFKKERLLQAANQRFAAIF